MTKSKILASSLALLAILSTACVGGGKGQSAEDKERMKAFVVESVPESAKKLDVNFENKIHLVGYRVEPENAPPGTDLKLTYYWRCDEPIEAGWALSTHVQHEGYDRPDNADAVGPLREWKEGAQIFGPSRWERGKIYVDEQTYKMPADIRGPESIVYLSIWKGDARLRVISGEALGARGPVAPRATEPLLLTLALERGDEVELDVARGHAAMVVVAEGTAEIGERRDAVPESSLVVTTDGERLRLGASEGPAQLVVIAGRPLQEPFVHRGPFVMGTMGDIEQAYEDYRAGRLG